MHGELELHVAGHADGSADVRGVLVPRDARPPTVLVAEGAGGRARCADTDGDGSGGLVEVAATFRNVRTGAPVPVAIAATGPDLDASGTYALSVEVGGGRAVMEARVHIPPGRAPG